MASLTRSIAEIAGADDWDYDPWGTAMSLFFDVASVLDMSDVEGDITPEPFQRWGYRTPEPSQRWGYRRPPFSVPAIETVAARGEDFNEGEWADDFTYGQVMLATAIQYGDLSQQDLIYAGDVLNKYTAQLRLAGKDY